MEFIVEDNSATVKCRMTMEHFYEFEISEINLFLNNETLGLKCQFNPLSENEVLDLHEFKMEYESHELAV